MQTGALLYMKEAGIMRRGIGFFLMGIGGLLKFIFTISLIVSAATGIWWPLTQAIIANPVSALWFIPLGFLLTGLSFKIITFVYDLVIAMPLTMLAAWLLGDEL